METQTVHMSSAQMSKVVCVCVLNRATTQQRVIFSGVILKTQESVCIVAHPVPSSQSLQAFCRAAFQLKQLRGTFKCWNSLKIIKNYI